jgi:hypothetical protein
MPEIDYTRIIQENNNPLIENYPFLHTIVYKVLEHRINRQIPDGRNVAGYIVFKAEQELTFNIQASTGQGMSPDTHPDQQCLKKIIQTLLDKEALEPLKADTIIPSHTVKPELYGRQLQEKIKNGEFNIIFFSERSPCDTGSNNCTSMIRNVLGEEFLNTNVFYVTKYTKSKPGTQNEMEVLFKEQVNSAKQAYKQRRIVLPIQSQNASTPDEKKIDIEDANISLQPAAIDTQSHERTLSTKRKEIEQNSPNSHSSLQSQPKARRLLKSTNIEPPPATPSTKSSVRSAFKAPRQSTRPLSSLPSSSPPFSKPPSSSTFAASFTRISTDYSNSANDSITTSSKPVLFSPKQTSLPIPSVMPVQPIDNPKKELTNPNAEKPDFPSLS